MKRKVGKRKKQLQQKYFFRKLLLTEGILIIAAVIILGGVFLVKRIRENVNTVSMVEEASGLDMDDSNSLAAVKAAMARPAEFSPKCVDSTSPSLYIETLNIEDDRYLPLAGWRLHRYPLLRCRDQLHRCGWNRRFRGNNFRDTAAYGNTQIKNGKIQDLWTAKTGSITYGDATWSGSGWTGQPLMEKWSQEVKKSMNMYDWAKEKDDLVEVIYACMDGYVYFLDLETGEATRDPLYLGFTFKGAGALDPRGYPIMYGRRL